MINAVEILVSRGHRIDDVLRRYTMNQVRAFIDAAATNIKRDAAQFAIGMRNARFADERSWKKFIDALIAKVTTRKKKPDQLKPEQVPFVRNLLHGKKRVI